MSVLKSKRRESKIEFVRLAYLIYSDTLAFLTRLSNRYSRLMSDKIMELASEVLDGCEKANSIYPSDDIKKELRKKYLLEARASLMALDVHMSIVYDILMQNPQGCFTKSNGSTIASAEAIAKLDKMAESLGNLIDFEARSLYNMIKRL